MTVLLFWLTFPAWAADFDQADQFFQNRQWQKAAAAYTALLSAPEPDRGRALFRAAESEALGQRPYAAYRLLQRVALTDNSLWKGRVLLLKAKLEQILATQARDQDEVAGPAIERWSSSQWHDAARGTYRQLVGFREILSNLPTEQEKTLLELKDADLAFAPTLWDVAVHQWSAYLLTIAPDPPTALPPGQLFDGPLTGSLAEDLPNATLAGRLFSQAATGDRKSREVARQYWRWKVRSLPMDFPQRVAQVPPATVDRGESLEELAEDMDSPLVRGMVRAAAARIFFDAKAPERAVTLCKEVENQSPKSFGAKQCVDLRAEIELPRFDLHPTSQPPPGTNALEVRGRNVPTLHFRLYPMPLAKDWKSLVRRVPRPQIEQALKTTPLSKGTFPMPAPKKFVETKASVPLPPLEVGTYLVVVSSDVHFDPGHSLLQSALVNITDLWVWGEGVGGKDPRFQAFAVSGPTGLPLKGVAIEAELSERWDQIETKTGQTDAKGSVQFQAPKGGTFRPLARWQGHTAYWTEGARFSPLLSPSLRGFFDTDRRVYRRGEAVQFRLTFLEKKGDHWLPTPQGKVKFSLKDPRRKVVLTQPGNLTGGVWTQKVRLPATGVLGSYELEAEFRGTTVRHSVAVEAFEKPRFEIQSKVGALVFGTDAEIPLDVATYQGDPVVGGTVKYTVYREPHIPPFCWWWPQPRGSRTLLQRGELRTNDSGRATLAFPVTADPTHPSRPARLRIEVTVTDPAGHSQTEEIIRMASAAPWILTPVSRHSLYGEGKLRVPLEFRSLDGERIAGEAAYSFRRLDAPPAPPAPRLENPDTRLLFAAQEGERVKSGVLKSDGRGPALASFAQATPGIYRLEVAAGPYAYSQIVTVIGDTAPPTPFLSSWSSDTARVGEEVTAWVGSQSLQGKILVQLWRGQTLLSSEWVSGPFHRFKLKIDSKHRGGVTLRWRGVFAHRFREGEAYLSVPWEHQFTATWEGPDRTAPAKKLSANLQASTSATGWLRVYDAKLDAIAPPPAPWIQSLYGAAPSLPASQTSGQPTPPTGIPVPSDRLEKQLGILRAFYRTLRPPQFPHLRPAPSFAYGGMRGGRPEMVMAMGKAADSGGPSGVRQNFADTAFFEGRLKLASGKNTVTVSVPDSLTRWKVEGGFLAEDGRVSWIESRFVSRNPFELELLLPRPVREGDRFELPVVVTNGTETRATATVRLKGHEKASQSVALSPGSSEVLTWTLAPEKAGKTGLTVSGRLGRYQDGEQRTLDVLSSRVPTILSVSALDRGKGKTSLKGQSLENVTRTHFTTAPQDATVLAHSLPAVLPVDVESFNQWIERWVGLSLLSGLLEKHPNLKAPSPEFLEFPRYGFLAPWDGAEGNNLWQSGTARRGAEKARAAWLAFQTKDGGFAWFAGGKPSRFLTLYALEAFVRASPNRRPSKDWKRPLDFVGLPRPDASPFELYVLSQYVRVKPALRGPLQAALKNAQTDSPQGLYHLIEAASALGDGARRKKLEAQLFDGLREDQSGGSWLGEPEGWRFFQDTIGLHASLLHYLLRTSPQSPHVWPLARWLWNHRHGNRWASRRGTLEAVAALLALSPTTGGDLSFQWNDTPVTTKGPWEGSLEGAAATSQWESGVVVTRKGDGVVYSTLMALGTQTTPEATPPGRPLHLQRRFYRQDGDRWQEFESESIGVGEKVRIELEITAGTPLEFVSVAVPRAGGLEPRESRSGWRWSSPSHYREVGQHEDRLHFPSLPQGTFRVAWEGIPKTRGDYLVAPARAQSQFAPDLTASTANHRLRIE